MARRAFYHAAPTAVSVFESAPTTVRVRVAFIAKDLAFCRILSGLVDGKPVSEEHNWFAAVNAESMRIGRKDGHKDLARRRIPSNETLQHVQNGKKIFLVPSTHKLGGKTNDCVFVTERSLPLEAP